jgi:hypothetical protein
MRLLKKKNALCYYAVDYISVLCCCKKEEEKKNSLLKYIFNQKRTF